MSVSEVLNVIVTSTSLVTSFLASTFLNSAKKMCFMVGLWLRSFEWFVVRLRIGLSPAFRQALLPDLDVVVTASLGSLATTTTAEVLGDVRKFGVLGLVHRLLVDLF